MMCDTLEKSSEHLSSIMNFKMIQVVPRVQEYTYTPSMYYIHERNMPYSHYHSPHLHHNCEIISLGNQPHMLMPPYLMPLMLLGSVLLFVLFAVGLLLLVDRARLTSVVTARQNNHPTVEDALNQAIAYYNHLNPS